MRREALNVTGLSGLLSPDAKESPRPTISRSSTLTLASLSSRPSGSLTVTVTPERLLSVEYGTRGIVNRSTHGSVRVSSLLPGACACHDHAHLPLPAAGTCAAASRITTVCASGRMKSSLAEPQPYLRSHWAM